MADNASTDGSAEMVRERFPEVRLVRHEENLGFGRAIDLAMEGVDADVLVVLNNDLVCEPEFMERVVAPFERAEVGMVAGVLVQAAAPSLIDSAGIELDATLRSWDYLWNRPVAELGPATPAPLGPCGGAAAYRLREMRKLGGFEDRLFAYWEDVDLAIRFREAGWECALAPDARAEHRHWRNARRDVTGAAAPGRVRPRLRAGPVRIAAPAGGRGGVRRHPAHALARPRGGGLTPARLRGGARSGASGAGEDADRRAATRSRQTPRRGVPAGPARRASTALPGLSHYLRRPHG